MQTLIYILALCGYLSFGVYWIIYIGEAGTWFTGDIAGFVNEKISSICERIRLDFLAMVVETLLQISGFIMYAALWPIAIPVDLIDRERRRRAYEVAHQKEVERRSSHGVNMV